jgi:hypothetical protein
MAGIIMFYNSTLVELLNHLNQPTPWMIPFKNGKDSPSEIPALVGGS